MMTSGSEIKTEISNGLQQLKKDAQDARQKKLETDILMLQELAKNLHYPEQIDTLSSAALRCRDEYDCFMNDFLTSDALAAEFKPVVFEMLETMFDRNKALLVFHSLPLDHFISKCLAYVRHGLDINAVFDELDRLVELILYAKVNDDV